MKENRTYKVLLSLLGLLYVGMGLDLVLRRSFKLSSLRISAGAVDMIKAVDLVFAILIGLVIISGGIGILRRKRWGRGIALFVSCAGALTMLLRVFISWREYNFQDMAPSILLGYCLLLVVFPVYFLTRQRVKEQFK